MKLEIRLLSGTVTESTMKMYEHHIGRYSAFAEQRQADPLSPLTFTQWRQLLVEADHSRNHICTAMASVRSVARAMCDAGLITVEAHYRFLAVKFPSEEALKHRRKDHQHITPEQMRAIIDGPDASTVIGLRDRALLLTIATAGLRVSELVALRCGDLRVQRARGEGHPVLSVVGKGDLQPRQVGISTEAVEAIRAWLAARPVDSEHIFTSLDGRGQRFTSRALSRVAAWKIVSSHAARAGLERLSVHDFRRFVGTQITNRFGLKAAAKQLGHKNPSITAKYYQTGQFEPSMVDSLV